MSDNWNKLMKKILTLLAMGLLSVSAFGQTSGTTVWKFSPLLSGYNVLISQTNTFLGLTTSNVQYTAYNGQVLFSLNTNLVFSVTNGVASSNQLSTIPAADAFKTVPMAVDANGDVNGNACLYLWVGYTNWVPNLYWVTNQSAVYVGGVTNYAGNGTTNTVFWPLLFGNAFPNWNFPATPQTYPTFVSTATNIITVQLFAGIGGNTLQGSVGQGIGMNFLQGTNLFETTPSFTCTFTAGGGVPQCFTTNLPTVFTQHARSIYCSISTTLPGTGITPVTNAIINQIGILQPN